MIVLDRGGDARFIDRRPVAKEFDVFVTGGTGYVGSRLIATLLARGHRVRALARQTSLGRLPERATPVVGDALDAESVAGALRSGDTLVHLVGTPHPNPSKARQFEQIDLVSIRAAVTAAKRVGIAQLVYVSVAQPAPIMRAYLAVRAAGERMIKEAGLTGDGIAALVRARSRPLVADDIGALLQDC